MNPRRSSSSQRLLRVRAGGSLVHPGGFCSCPSAAMAELGPGWEHGLHPPCTGTSRRKPLHSPGCSPEINGGSYLWRHVCNGPMNFMEIRCCGGVWYWVLLPPLLKLMPLKSHPSAASPV